MRPATLCALALIISLGLLACPTVHYSPPATVTFGSAPQNSSTQRQSQSGGSGGGSSNSTNPWGAVCVITGLLLITGIYQAVQDDEETQASGMALVTVGLVFAVPTCIAWASSF